MPFVSSLMPGHGQPDVTFSCLEQEPHASDVERLVPTYSSPEQINNGHSNVYFYALGTCDILRLTGQADFYLYADRILCRPATLLPDEMIEIRLLGPVLSFWLERRGLPTLHAAAVTKNGRTAVFLSGNRGGKSSLAAALLQAGYSLLTDDVLAIERRASTFFARSGYPQMRLWPDQAHHFLGHAGLERVLADCDKRRVPIGPGRFGLFCPTSQPLTCIYLPDRHCPEISGSNVTIAAVPPHFAAFELVRHTFTPRLVEAAGLQSARLALFSALIEAIQVRRVSYPNGYESLPAARDAILADLESL
ncbi:MAG: hypothetical protein JXM73_18575 [Anaerolineae bacterium]|nr:hypothetical protein [Anaerolineae bacterium]